MVYPQEGGPLDGYGLGCGSRHGLCPSFRLDTVVKALLIVVGSLMTLGGLLWTMQGLGYLGGSPMTGEPIWAIVGPLVAGLGVALLYVALRGGSGRDTRR